VFIDLYKKMLPTVFKLAVDVEQVTRQLFHSLVMQMIHWFTNARMSAGSGDSETDALLEVITDCVGHDSDGALRSFAADCMAEFLKWSLKQAAPSTSSASKSSSSSSSSSAAAQSPVHVTAMLGRVYSLARHPSPFKVINTFASHFSMTYTISAYSIA
jgi:DNA-dependent protein kinase catalytic subunit